MSDIDITEIEKDPFIKLSRRVLLTLENLIKNSDIKIPVSIDTMLELAIGALTDAQTSGDVELTEVFYEHKEFTFDTLVFEENGEYTLHDILAQVVCFRLINMMKEFLDHIDVSYEEDFDISDE